ncbi:hypothetical protein [Crassaminicella thermophila]|uniref:hypothetical protein n=1 Tax=Crassaminicella thermophila TaxID=2599308 RepID=UPI001A9B0002|nr:hypothetical protein [Crassaminicella thermophila]
MKKFDLCIADCKRCNGINVEHIERNVYKCKETGKVLLYMMSTKKLREIKSEKVVE